MSLSNQPEEPAKLSPDQTLNLIVQIAAHRAETALLISYRREKLLRDLQNQSTAWASKLGRSRKIVEGITSTPGERRSSLPPEPTAEILNRACIELQILHYTAAVVQECLTALDSTRITHLEGFLTVQMTEAVNVVLTEVFTNPPADMQLGSHMFVPGAYTVVSHKNLAEFLKKYVAHRSQYAAGIKKAPDVPKSSNWFSSLLERITKTSSDNEIQLAKQEVASILAVLHQAMAFLRENPRTPILQPLMQALTTNTNTSEK